ncbi:MAG: replicative DNA helicase [Desulfobacterales bacterium]|nr:replicative DNA helicase [Desulfobacterales bacterium]
MAENAKNIIRDPSLYKVPPHNLEAEESLLSAILLDNETLIEVMDVLIADDFYKTAHQQIFTVISELSVSNTPIDLVTVSNRLKEAGHLESVGGATYLARLTDTVPLAVNAKHYAEIIHDKACLRRLIAKAGEITARCFADNGEVNSVIDYAESAIFEIAENKLKAPYSPLSKIIDINIDQLEERQGNKSLITGIATGYKELDALTSGLQGSDLIILAARPSMGKTAFALNVARNAAIDGNAPTAIFSLEMAKEQLSMRLLCAEAKIDSNRLRTGFFSREDWVRLTDAAGVLSEAPVYIDDTPNISAMEIRAKVRRLKREKDIGMVIVDYLQLMQGRQSAERRDLEISEISRSLKGLAKEMNIPIIALSQLNRKLEERADKRPMLSDLRESGALEQDADMVAFIYRDEVYNKDENNPNRGKAEIILSKHRNGPTGVAHLAFLKSYTRFEDLAPDHYSNMAQ